jgi:hypothetical protein
MADGNTRRPDLGASHARVPNHVVHRTLAHETVVLNLKTGRYHGLNPTAGRMLAELEGGGTLHEIAVRLADVYALPVDELEGDLAALSLDLLSRDLIELLDSDDRPLVLDVSSDGA